MSASVYIAVPCFGGLMQAICARSVTKLTHDLAAAGIAWTVDMELHESLVQRARNSLVHRFLKTKHTHLLFIDADIQFDGHDVIGMLGADKPLVCGAYPKKTLDVSAIADAVRRNEPDPMAFAANYAVNVLPGPPGAMESTLTADKGCVPILDAPTGFMLVHRDVFLEMAAKHPETLYCSDSAQDRFEAKHAFFDCAIVDGRYLSEDYLFSRRWQNMGGTVWLFLPAKLGHIGSFTYRGNLFNTFEPIDAPKGPRPEDSHEWSLPEDESFDDGQGMVWRYEWAAKHLTGKMIANACSGPGYGMPILQRKGASVVNFDRSEDCQRICDERGWVPFVLGDASEWSFEGFDALCTLETLEHLPDPIAWLRAVSPDVKEIVISVPVVPTKRWNAYHLHDFTYDGMLKILAALGWEVKAHEYQGGAAASLLAYAVR